MQWLAVFTVRERHILVVEEATSLCRTSRDSFGTLVFIMDHLQPRMWQRYLILIFVLNVFRVVSLIRMMGQMTPVDCVIENAIPVPMGTLAALATTTSAECALTSAPMPNALSVSVHSI